MSDPITDKVNQYTVYCHCSPESFEDEIRELTREIRQQLGRELLEQFLLEQELLYEEQAVIIRKVCKMEEQE